MRTLIPVENDNTLATVQGFLRKLMESGLVDALYVPLEGEGGIPIPALVTDPVMLEDANPIAPVMPINGARAISALTNKGITSRLGVVLRPCEQRALIELVKLQQASLENVVIISLDCFGTIELSDYQASLEGGNLSLNSYLTTARDGIDKATDTLNLRPACQMCIQPVSDNADIVIELFGLPVNEGIQVAMNEELAGRLGYSSEENPINEARSGVLERLRNNRHQTRDNEFSGINERVAAEGSIAGLFTTCIRCHNCMTVCPICYCKTCLFKTASFDHPPEHYFKLAHRKGATRMLGDTLLFHMTRLNHMSASCVSCGMCTSACPADIPVGLIFSAIGSKVQTAFDYVPGRSIDETLPLITFQPDEWTQVGEAKAR
jgi:formate dehydrogenase subunit beta